MGFGFKLMAEKNNEAKIIKLQIKAGAANPAPPRG